MNLGKRLLKLGKIKGLLQEEAADKLIPIFNLYEVSTEKLLTENKKCLWRYCRR